MKITLQIPDELYDDIAKASGSSARVPGHILSTLKAFGTVLQEKDRYILLRGDDRRAIEAIFRTTVADSKELITKVKKLASFAIGPVERTLDFNELAVLKEQASFHGSEPEAYLRFVANEIIDRSLGRI